MTAVKDEAQLLPRYRRLEVITPFKIIQDHWFWYQSKVCVRLPISDQY